MQPLLPVFVILLLLAILLPPVLLVVTILRRQKRIGWSRKSPLLAAATVLGVLALSFNGLFVLLRLGEILSSSLASDGFMLLALAVSWFSFFGRILLKSTSRHKRRLRRSRTG